MKELGPSIHPREEWSFSQEREFIENLLNQRFNFLLVLFSLFFAAGATLDFDRSSGMVMLVGAAVSLLISATIFRAHVKHRWLMKRVYLTADHPARWAEDHTRKMGWKALGSVGSLIGWILPLICTLFLAVAGLMTILCPELFQ